MVRYRKGNRFLSEEEYIKDVTISWIVALFFIGAFISGYATYSGIADLTWPKWANFTLIIIAGFIGGGVLGALHKQIRFLIAFGITAGILYLLGSLLWDKI
ncbi:MAG: hypothetical protein GY834_08900 [Bacteroidetes bacterium]|nr:hypothetical protein [Bacteroidota bacterium]